LKTVEVDGCAVDVLPIIRGLVDERWKVADVLAGEYDAVGIALGAERIEAIRLCSAEERKKDDDDVEVSNLDLVYGHFLLNYGHIALPDPAYSEAIKICAERSVELIPLDMDEAAYADMFCEKVGTLELFKEERIAKKALKRKFNSSSPQEFVIEWDEYVNKKLKGSYLMSLERETFIANSIANSVTGKKRMIVIVELERMAGILDLLGWQSG